MEGRFRQKCPSCTAQKKIVFKCRKCFRLACSECSIRGMCNDCYLKLTDMDEVENYYAEKYNLTEGIMQ